MSTPVPTLLRVKPSKASESDRFNERYGKRAHERAVELGYALPVFHTHDVDVNYYRQQQELRKQQEPRKQQELRKQQDLQKRQDLQKQQELQKQKDLQERQEQKTQRIQQKRQKKRLRRREEREELEELRKQREQQKQHANETPPRVAIALPPIQPLLYPPPGPEEGWSQQQISEWRWQQCCCYMQQTFQKQDQEVQNQLPQWQQFYRQYQLQYWHRQQAQYYASLSRLTLPDPADLFRLSAPPDFLVAASNPGIGHIVASLGSHADPDASLTLPAHLPATRPSLKRSRSLSPPRGRAESPIHGSRRLLVPSLTSARLSPGHRNNYASPLAPPIQPRDAVIGPTSSLVASSTCSESLNSPATTVPGLPHGLPVSVPKSSFSSNDIVWPVLTDAEFANMTNAQQQWQQQFKCEE
jgi:hypothetical protein